MHSGIVSFAFYPPPSGVGVLYSSKEVINESES